jgi:integrase
MAPEKRITVYILEPKDRPYFKLEWVEPGTLRRKSKSTKTSDPKEAEEQRKDKEYELNHGLHHEPSRMEWKTFREKFMEEYAGGQRARSREKLGTVFDVFEDIIRPARLEDIKAPTLAKFLRGMRDRKRRGGRVGLAPITMHHYLVVLKTALGYAVSQGYLQKLPAFPEVKVSKKKPQPIPQADFDALLAKAPDAAWRAYLLCGWWGGLRLSEAYSLQWERCDKLPWLDLEADAIRFPAEFVKSDEDQWIPIHPELRKAIEALPRERPDVFWWRSKTTGERLTRNGVTSKVISLAKLAGVKLSMHRLRKGFGCRVAKKLGKGNAPILHRMMRHSSMQVTMDYYASVDDALHDAMKQL